MKVPPTTISTWAKAIYKTLEKKGFDQTKVFKEAGINTEILKDPDKRIKLTSMNRLWNQSVKITGDSSFGLGVAENAGPESFHALGHAILASSIENAIKRVMLYYKMISDAVELDLSEKNGEISLNFRYGPVKPTSHAMDAFLASIVIFSKRLTGKENIPVKVKMVRKKPEKLSPYKRIFGEEISFSEPFDSFILLKGDLKREIPDSDAKKALYYDSIIVKYLEEFEGRTIVEKVRSKIIELLTSSEPTLEEVAKSVAMSKRTLNRCLNKHNETFRGMLGEIKCELAQRYLIENRYSIIEIAFILGYTDPSNFSRAFKKWSGLTPKEFRKKRVLNL